MSEESDVATRLGAVRERIARAAERSGRQPDAITLVGVSKRQPLERVTAALHAGLRTLGENMVQEALAKRPEIEAALAQSGTPLPRWHFVGHLQRNKARDAARHFDVIETVDSERLGRELERRAAGEARELEILLQVNVSGESQKAGAAPDALPGLLAASTAWPHLRVTGLMAIPAAEADPERSRPAFAKLRSLAESLAGKPEGAGLRQLSMGMSHDFEVAIEEGATIVRVGTAIFGPREPRRNAT